MMNISIVIPTFNQYEYTENCLRSIMLTDCSKDAQIIIVDNGSTDGTPDRVMADFSADLNINLIRNLENRGVSKAWNQGLISAVADHHAEKIVIINNDIVAYPGWIEEMLKIDAWAVVPRHTAGDYTEETRSFYEKHIKGYEGPDSVPLLLKGFCFMLDRKGLQEMYLQELFDGFSVENDFGVALFDEQFEMAHYEDTDFDNRLRRLGHAPLECQRAYIHHYQSRTLMPNLGDLMPFIEGNAARYNKKYGIE